MDATLATLMQQHALCDAELALRHCVLSSTTFTNALTTSRIQFCTNQYVTLDCAKSKSHGLNCRRITLTRSLWIYHDTLRYIPLNHAWPTVSALGIMKAVQIHANCKSRAYFTILQTMSDDQCHKSQDIDIFPQLLDYLENQTVSMPPDFEYNMQDELSTQLIQDTLGGLITSYDPVWNKTRTIACSYPPPNSLIDGVNGTDMRSIQFHFPIVQPVDQIFTQPFRHTQHEGPAAIEATCAKYFEDTKQKYVPQKSTSTSWQWIAGYAMRRGSQGEIECFSYNGNMKSCDFFESQEEVALLPHNSFALYQRCPLVNDPSGAVCAKAYSTFGNMPDKCFSYSEFSIELDGKLPQAVHLESLPHDPFCKLASWTDDTTCDAKNSRWHMKVACCKSYETVVAEERASRQSHQHEPSEENGFISERGINTKMLVYEQTFTSTSGDVQVIRGKLYPPQYATRVSGLEPLDVAMQLWYPLCNRTRESVDSWCSAILNRSAFECMKNKSATWCKPTTRKSIYLDSESIDHNRQLLLLMNFQCESTTPTQIKSFLDCAFIPDLSHTAFPIPSYVEYQVALSQSLEAIDSSTWFQLFALGFAGFFSGVLVCLSISLIYDSTQKRSRRSHRKSAVDEVESIFHIN